MSIDDLIRLAPRLRDPRLSLPAYGYVQNQKDGTPIRFDPYAITEQLQATVVSYFAQPPIINGQTAFLALLGYRQGGKSTTAEIAAYPLTAYTPGHDHVCIADRNDRAGYLHKRVHYTHTRWPEAIRVPTERSREVMQLTFDRNVGGKMRILSMQQSAVGIGESPDSVHWSEVGFADYAEDQWTLMLPAVINRDHCRFIAECTPTPSDAGGTAFWQDMCRDAQQRKGRWVYAFFPFWDGKLNRRNWERGQSLDNEEIRLLEKYGTKGLTYENLAFRRLMIDSDPQIRRNNDLFGLFYPFDDLSCWISSSSGVIHSTLLKRHADFADVDWVGPYMEYEEPEANAIYRIGVDPSGFGVRDHAAFQVLKVYDGEWTQVACYSDNISNPVQVARKLIDVATKYNNALIVIEANGVGAAIIALLLQAGYDHLYYSAARTPGWTSGTTANETAFGWLIDALMDTLILKDKDTVGQLASYKNDKRIETAVVTELLRNGRPARGRRERHHWDKVSALIMAIVGARDAPRRRKINAADSEVVIKKFLYREMTYSRQQEYVKQVEAASKPKKSLTYQRKVGRS